MQQVVKVKHSVLVTGASLLTVLLVYLIRTQQTFSIVAYAFRLFSTLIHEMGHSLAAEITGGNAHGFVVNAGSGGYALTSGVYPGRSSLLAILGVPFLAHGHCMFCLRIGIITTLS